MRTTIHSNSFVEENFWETHYDFVKEKYINGKENFVYIIDGKIVAFTGVTEDNRITGFSSIQNIKTKVSERHL